MKLQLQLMRYIREKQPGTLLMGFILSLLKVMQAVLGLYLTKLVISLVIRKVALSYMIQSLLIYSVVLLIISISIHFVNQKYWLDGQLIRIRTFPELTNTLLSFDFQLFEDDKVLSLREQAFMCSNNDDALFGVYNRHWATFLTTVFQVFIYGGLLILLDQVIISLLLVMIFVLAIYRKYQNNYILKTKPEIDRVGEQLSFMERISGRFSVAKDMRLYGVSNWFNDIQDELLMKRQKIHGKRLKVMMVGNLISASFSIFLGALGYYILINQVINQTLSIDEFVFLFAAISQLTGLSSQIVNDLANLRKDGKEFEIYRQYLDYPQIFNHQTRLALPEEDLEITFENVSFTYPNAKSAVFENLNLTIHKNEKCALVGLNGSGKTTLVKLLVGLYKPDSGRILINGIDNQKYNIKDYYTLFSAVFQDTHIWPYPIRDLIIQGLPFDETRYRQVLELSGVDQIIEKAPKGDQTLIASVVDEEAIALSGGQMQKLKLAQALYKDGRMLILDEPTAALDPLAENEVYQNYFTLAKDKTSLFITHRLASTQFCDRILYLEDGLIKEDGTHQELMQLKGSYYEMYDKQSYYYRQEGGYHA